MKINIVCAGNRNFINTHEGNVKVVGCEYKKKCRDICIK